MAASGHFKISCRAAQDQGQTTHHRLGRMPMGFPGPSIQQATSAPTAHLQTTLGKPAVAFTGFLVSATT